MTCFSSISDCHNPLWEWVDDFCSEIW